MGKKNKGSQKKSKSSSCRWLWIGLLLAIITVIGFNFHQLVEIFEGGQTTEGVKEISRNMYDVQGAVKVLENTTKLPDGVNIFSDEHNSEFLWGMYRPHLYYGMRTRVGIDSLMLGFMWYQPGPNPYHIELRHVSKTDEDVKIWWERNDGKSYGKQIINDTRNGILITTTFVKAKGGDWIARIKGESYVSGGKRQKLSLMTYLGIDNKKDGNIKFETSQCCQKPVSGQVRIGGYTPATKDFTFSVTSVKESGKKDKTTTYYSSVSADEVWRIEKNLRLVVPKRTNRATAQLENILNDDSNVVVLQKFKKVPFEMEMVFVSNTEKYETAGVSARINYLSSNFNDLYEEADEKFDDKFENTFGLERQQDMGNEEVEFAKNTLSNLMAGIGFFYGHNKIANQSGSNNQGFYHSQKQHGLFTATPSRKFFPRGFLWDEGFHQLIISVWNKDLSKDMIMHWLRLMDNDGWIPREQILGSEAESRVPPEFVVQYKDHANPPTLFLAVSNILEKSDRSQDDILFLKGVYPYLVKNYIWYIKNQVGNTTNSFRWRGAKNNHTLSSGLDDYPRARVRSELEEHLDLTCWIAMTSGILDKLSKAVGIYDITEFKNIENELRARIFERHWSDQYKSFCDYDGLEGAHIDHIGYVSLFPFFFGYIPSDSPQLGHVLNIMEDTRLLKSAFGLRSLSISDPMFGTDENYWRGPVWVNINYLSLRALYKYYTFGEGPYVHRAKNIYTTLRRNLINNIFTVYKTQNDIFEQYDPHTGRGKGQHPFAGWTSLIILIMAEKY